MTEHEQAAFKGASSVKRWPTPLEQRRMENLQGKIPPEEPVEKLVPLTLREAVEFWAAPVAIIALLVIGFVGMLW